MPQARSSGGSSSRSTSGAKSGAASRAGKRSTGGASGTRAKSTRASSSASKRSTASKSTSRASAAKSAASAADARVEAVAARVRKLNERIIDASKDAGETTLTNYEKALKAIASGIEKGPGKSEVEWISTLATAQAKFIRDVTAAWTSAARKVLK